MSDKTKIEWTDATWNPVTGCSVVSPGCTNCYAQRLAGTRLRAHPSRAGLTVDSKAGPVWTGEVRLNEGWLDQPLRWAQPRMIFVCAHGDLFHERVPNDWIDRIWSVMAACPRHTFQVLTKRADRMRKYVAAIDGENLHWRAMQTLGRNHYGQRLGPLANVWLGVSVEDQRRADERIPFLLDTPAVVRWISAEPLLGPLDLRRWLWCAGRRIDWVVPGGESGPDARPQHPDWALSLRDQCDAASVPFLFKQWGEWAPYRPAPGGDLGADCRADRVRIVHRGGEDDLTVSRLTSGRSTLPGSTYMARVGKRTAGRTLDGVVHDAFPAQHALASAGARA